MLPLLANKDKYIDLLDDKNNIKPL